MIACRRTPPCLSFFGGERGEADTPEGSVEVIVDGGGCGMAEGSEAPTTLNWSANCARNVSGAPAVWEHR